MKRIRRVIGFFIMIMLSGVIVSVAIINTSDENEVDMVALNTVSKLAAENWDNIDVLKTEIDGEYIIFDRLGNSIACSNETRFETLEAAIRNGQSPMNIIKDGQLLGSAIIPRDNTEVLSLAKRRIVRVVIGISLLEVVLVFGCGLVLYKKVLEPFKSLKKFASEVAKGHLDFPLEMDRENIFGAFTESFDIMREELNLARKREYEANQSKKELIAALSHDIKTPVTGIKLISELLVLQVDKDEIKEKINSIYNKAEQINVLVTNMFQSTLEELGQFKIEVKDEYASKIGELFSEMDYEGKITQQEIPECIICVDMIRMEQIINNIVSNSYKYAGTPIEIRYKLNGGYLQVETKDYGKGVSAEEIPLIFNKFYRGKEKNIREKSGAGLGLYISKTLIENMGGEISCFNEEDGFVVRLLVPMSGGSNM